jgi:hypothetical protein
MPSHQDIRRHAPVRHVPLKLEVREVLVPGILDTLDKALEVQVDPFPPLPVPLFFFQFVRIIRTSSRVGSLQR